MLNGFSAILQIVVLAGQTGRELISLAPVCQSISQKGGKRSLPFLLAIWGSGFGVELLLPENDYNSHQHEKAGGYLRDVFFVACQFRLELFVYLDTYDCYRHEPY